MTDQPNALLEALEPILQAIAKSGKIEAVDRHSIAVALTFSRPAQPGGDEPVGQVRVEANGEWILKGWATNLPEGVHWLYAAPQSRPTQPSGEVMLPQYGASLSHGFSLAADEVRAAHAYLDERDASKYWDVGDGKLHPMSLAERIGSIPTTPAREAIEAAAQGGLPQHVEFSGALTDADWDRAHKETERLSRELNISNADHIALWLEANMSDSPLAWLACRIVESHEAAIRALALPSNPGAPDAVALEAHVELDWLGGLAKKSVETAGACEGIDAAISLIRSAITHPPAASGGEALASRIADMVCVDVAELPDRTSPDDQPDMMLVETDELHAIVRRAVEYSQSLSALSTHAGNGGQSEGGEA